jgi:lysophospholipase L1-like esterase
MAGRFGPPTWSALALSGALLGAALLTRCGTRPVADPAAPVERAQPVATPSAPQAASTLAPPPEPAGEPDAARADPEPVTAAAIGDSLTDERVGGGGYLKVLRKKCPESVFDDFGKGADMVNQMRRRFFREVIRTDGRGIARPKFTHVLIFGGVNDLYSDLTAGRTVGKISKDLSAMYSASKLHGAAVVAITVAPWGGFRKYYNARRGAATQNLNSWIATQRDERAIDTVVDAYALLSCGDPERLCPDYSHAINDGLHFGPAGHERLGQALADQVFVNCR